MSYNTFSKHALRTAGLSLAIAAAFALPQASAQQAQEASADSAVVVKDATTGKLRAATVQENNELKAAGQAKKSFMRIAPKATLNKYNKNGAAGVRLTDDMISSSVVVRAADGSLVQECVGGEGHANHAPHAAKTAPTPVTE
jgi:hypothetical protein